MNVTTPIVWQEARSFDWADPFLLQDQLSDEERMIRDSARAYTAEKLAPRVRGAFAEERTDPAIFAEMGGLGMLGVTIPEEHGGLGAGYVAYDWIKTAMHCYAKAERIRPADNDESILRWNTCARLLQRRADIKPSPHEDAVEQMLG